MKDAATLMRAVASAQKYENIKNKKVCLDDFKVKKYYFFIFFSSRGLYLESLCNDKIFLFNKSFTFPTYTYCSFIFIEQNYFGVKRKI